MPGIGYGRSVPRIRQPLLALIVLVLLLAVGYIWSATH
jgi:hypothetical protein